MQDRDLKITIPLQQGCRAGPAVWLFFYVVSGSAFLQYKALQEGA